MRRVQRAAYKVAAGEAHQSASISVSSHPRDTKSQCGRGHASADRIGTLAAILDAERSKCLRRRKEMK